MPLCAFWLARRFGLMDNLVMLSCGDLIDQSFGVKFGLATLTAAACGQVVSDVCGVCFGGVVQVCVVIYSEYTRVYVRGSTHVCTYKHIVSIHTRLTQVNSNKRDFHGPHTFCTGLCYKAWADSP
jgi:hypothetical protein